MKCKGAFYVGAGCGWYCTVFGVSSFCETLCSLPNSPLCQVKFIHFCTHCVVLFVVFVLLFCVGPKESWYSHDNVFFFMNVFAAMRSQCALNEIF